MKKLVTLLVCLTVLGSFVTGCASAPVSADAKARLMAARPEIEVVRGILRPTITVFAQKNGIPAAATTSALQIVDPVIDIALDCASGVKTGDACSDNPLGALTDSVTWKSARSSAIDNLATRLQYVKVSGTQIFPDHDTNASLIAPFLDSLAVQLQALLKQRSAPASGGAS